jgi:hypothetical protein
MLVLLQSKVQRFFDCSNFEQFSARPCAPRHCLLAVHVTSLCLCLTWTPSIRAHSGTICAISIWDSSFRF